MNLFKIIKQKRERREYERGFQYAAYLWLTDTNAYMELLLQTEAPMDEGPFDRGVREAFQKINRMQLRS